MIAFPEPTLAAIMSPDFIRSIEFVIPGSATSPALKVRAVEHDGALVFDVTVLSTATLTADLRGVFFNMTSASVLADLVAGGALVTGYDTVKVIDLGNGANLHGAAKSFDVGVEFGTQGMAGDDIQTASFTLDHPTLDLTLDHIANMQFGARMTSVGVPLGDRSASSKLVATAPAAPDARADSYTIFEDGAAGLAAPSHAPAGTLFQVLANDTDADGSVLSVTALRGVAHGTVEIVDGADADTLPGDAVLYRPDTDYAGSDSFEYLISDGAGGTDFATVSVEVVAVADAPLLSYEIVQGASFNEIVVRVTTSQTDADSSEFMDRIELSGIPAGVQVSASGYNPPDQPDLITRDFVLTLPLGQDSDFALGITAIAKETSNGDEQSTFVAVPVALNHTMNQSTTVFTAANQSMWGSGDAFTYSHSAFYGTDSAFNGSMSVGGLSAGLDVSYQFGIQSELTISSGQVNATVPYTASIETSFNKTTGWLHFSTSASALLNESFFNTVSPNVTYQADLVANLNGSANIGIAFEFGGIDLGLFSIPGFGFNESLTIPMPGNNGVNIVDFDGESISVFGMSAYDELEVPLGDFATATFSIPHLSTTSAVTGDRLTAEESTDFLEIELDVDDLVATLLRLDPSPFHQEAGVAGGLFHFSNDVLNYSMQGKIGVGQEFEMTLGMLSGILILEDGHATPFTFGDELDIFDAFSHDANGDGQVGYIMQMRPNATFSNDLLLTLALGHEFSLFEVTGTLDLPDWVPLDDPGFHVGPVYDPNLPDIASTDVKLVGFQFALNLGAQSLVLIA